MPCPHLSSAKRVNAADLNMRAQGACDKCEKRGDLWACLQACCSYVGCGRCGNNHIELHNQETDHHLCINLEKYNVWCFSCGTDVEPSSASSAESPTPNDREMPYRTQKGPHTTDEDDYYELEQGLKPRGLCGLMNIGNTCYMNAALQALSNCPPLTQFFLECNACIGETKHPGVAWNYFSVVKELWSRKRSKYIVPTQLLRSVRAVNSQFRGYGQQDAQEFLRCIMDQLHEELKQPLVSYVSDSNSSDESDEPSHQAKRLLGGTSLTSSSLHDDGNNETPFERSHGKRSPVQECAVQSSEMAQECAVQSSDMPLDRRRSSAVLHSSDIQINIEMAENEEESDEEAARQQGNSGVQSMEVESTSSTLTMMRTESFDGKKPTSAVDAKMSSKKSSSPVNRVFKHTSKKKDGSRIVNYHSIITDLFDGRLQSSVQCLTCNRVSSRIETFQDLSLPIPGKDELSVIHASQCAPLVTCSRGDEYPDEEKSWVMTILDWVRRWLFGPLVTLQDCLSAFFSADELKGDNMYSCEKCKKLRNGIKLCKVVHLPEILCIHLKRFRHEMYFSSKISNFISFPVTCLDMKPFLLKDARNNLGKRPTTTYDLVAVITHHGNVGAGHYVAFAKNYISGTWFEFNDSWVNEVPESYVAGVEAYVLFYRKTSEESKRERKTFTTMMNCKESFVQCYYISRLWLTKFQTCSEPGPISNTDFICPHGGIHPKRQGRIKDLVTAVPLVVWSHLYNRFGGGPTVSSLEPCQHCQAALEELERRRQYEVESFKQLNTDYPAADHVDVYCISMRWFRQWEAFVKAQEEDPPGPIDNRNIVIVKGNQKILKSMADYGQVAKETWEYMHGIYGGGPSFVLEAETEEV